MPIPSGGGPGACRGRWPIRTWGDSYVCEMRNPLRWSPVFLVATCALVFWGCAAGPKPGESERSGRAFTGKTLAVILPDSASAEARNPEDLLSVFAPESAAAPGSVLAREFGEAFFTAFAADIDFVTPVRMADSLPRAPADQRIAFPVAGMLTLQAHEYAVPAQAWLASQGIAADLALVVGPVASATGTDDIISPKFGGHLKVTYVALEGWYMIWDYAAGRPLAYGRFRPTVEYKRNQTAREWAKVFDKAVEAVGEASPFKGPKWYRR